MHDIWVTVLGGIVVAVITVGGSVLTNRTAKRTAESTARITASGEVTSARIAAEEGAFERARDGYEAAIQRRDTEIAELEADLTRVKRELAEMKLREADLVADISWCTTQLEAANIRPLPRRNRPDPPQTP